MTPTRRPYCATCDRFLTTTKVNYSRDLVPVCRRCGDRVTMRPWKGR